MVWTAKKLNDVSVSNPILIEGLPGIGNVGKVAVDFIIDELETTKLFEFHCEGFPNCVFVNESNLIELPSIALHHTKVKGKDFLILAGDIQPAEDDKCHEFTDALLNAIESLGCKEIVVLGGIGLHSEPKDPKVFCTGNTKSVIDTYCAHGVSNEIYGVVGPIVGVTGLLLGLSLKRDISAVAILAETFSHPMHLGVEGAKEILNVLNTRFEMNLEVSKIDEDIAELQSELAKAMPVPVKKTETAYIG